MSAIRLLLAEVEGTLLAPGDVLTAETERAVRRLRDADIQLAITSGRPPRGMRTLIAALRITAPVSGFDGGMLVRPDLSLLEQHALGDQVAGAVIASMEQHGLDVWVYQRDAWRARRPDATHVAQEETTAQFAPEPVEQWDDRVHDSVKIAGRSDDADALARCETDLEAHRAYVSVVRSRPCSLAVTHPRANTGELVRTLSRYLGVTPAAIAAIGQAPNAVLMFRECGLAVAMGQAGAAVQRRAHYITRSNEDEGFAHAVETWVLNML
jgi:Cof subfamily protein (haloacid dehalogenase superfamily)